MFLKPFHTWLSISASLRPLKISADTVMPPGMFEPSLTPVAPTSIGIDGATSVLPSIFAASIAVRCDMMVWPARILCGPRASVPPLAMMTLMKPCFCFSTTSLEVRSSSSTISLTGLPICAEHAGAPSSRHAINTVNLFISPPRPHEPCERGGFYIF